MEEGSSLYDVEGNRKVRVTTLNYLVRQVVENFSRVVRRTRLMTRLLVDLQIW